MIKRFLALCLFVLALAGLAQAEEMAFTIHAQNGGYVDVLTTTLEGEKWLFLPSFADQDDLKLDWLDGAPDAEGVRRGTAKDGSVVHVMQSQNLRSLFLFSADPVNQGRAYIDGAVRHSLSTTGSMAIVDVDGTVDHSDSLRQLRGRGNGTWERDKKPYQFKLESRADLLKTGDKSERGRTWVLLADVSDPTMLHNRVALDLALEIGLEETSHSEHVDLYYDGEYRGLYLLAEKVEIDQARINQTDYGELLETWNEHAGIHDLETLEAKSGENRFGKFFTYIDGVEDSDMVSAGAYLLELESSNNHTLTDRCYFKLDQEGSVALKNPENASESMVRYISERFTEARMTIQNGGVNPETGRTIEEEFDVDGFARAIMVNEVSSNLDGFVWSSTFFVLPAGEQRFVPGPVWDFNLAWMYFTDGSNAEGMGFKERTGWMYDFYQCRPFSDAMYRVWTEDMEPALSNVLLGGGEGKYLKSLDAYVEEITPSVRMNSKRWDVVPIERMMYAQDDQSFEDNVALMRRFISERTQWMDRAIAGVNEKGADLVDINLRILYGHADSALDFWLPSWSGVTLSSFTCDLAQEATEDEFGVYEVEALFDLKEGYAFTQPEVYLNNRPVSHEITDEGQLRLYFSFVDPSYRPVDYYGDDAGYIFDYDYYAEHYPDVVEMCEDDREAVLDYFFDEGIYECHQANAYFNPAMISIYNPYLKNNLGEDWQNWYWDFMYYGHEEGWLYAQDLRFRPEVTDLL